MSEVAKIKPATGVDTERLMQLQLHRNLQDHYSRFMALPEEERTEKWGPFINQLKPLLRGDKATQAGLPGRYNETVAVGLGVHLDLLRERMGLGSSDLRRRLMAGQGEFINMEDIPPPVAPRTIASHESKWKPTKVSLDVPEPKIEKSAKFIRDAQGLYKSNRPPAPDSYVLNEETGRYESTRPPAPGSYVEVSPGIWHGVGDEQPPDVPRLVPNRKRNERLSAYRR